LFGVILLWVLEFIPAIDNFSDFSHQQVSEWLEFENNTQSNQPQEETG